jgi:dTDP-4-amino-4,6-dideoxygalactose transaminase
MRAVPRVNFAPPLPFGIYARRPSKRLPFPLEEPKCRIFSLARHALFLGVKNIGLEPGDEVLVPAYHHGSEVEALVRAGMECRFYDIGWSLEPDEDDLEALLGPRVRALHLTHFLGLPQDAARWRAWCDQRGLLLIEDAAQAWLSLRDGVPVGSHGDLTIFCLYKTFGVPDGAAVVCDPPLDPPDPGRSLGIGRVVREHRIYLEQQWPWLNELRRRLKGAGANDPKRGMMLGDPTRGPYASTTFLLPRVADTEAQKVRASHYALLLERLGQLVPEPLVRLQLGASPFAFPIRSGRKADVLERLYRYGVVAPNYWPVAHPALRVASDFPGSAALRKDLVALPVHQELGTEELERLVAAVQ